MDRMGNFSFHLRCRSCDSSILSSVDVVVERPERVVCTKRPATYQIDYNLACKLARKPGSIFVLASLVGSKAAVFHQSLVASHAPGYLNVEPEKLCT